MNYSGAGYIYSIVNKVSGNEHVGRAKGKVCGGLYTFEKVNQN